MKTARSLLRKSATAALFCFAIGGQMLASGTAQAHGPRHLGIDRSYNSYQGSVAERSGAFWGQAPNGFRHDDEPTLSERVGTN